MPNRSGLSFLLVVSVLVAMSSPVRAATPAQKCAAKKIGAVAKATTTRLGCQKKAVLQGLDPDPECLSKAQSALTAAFQKIIAKGGCTVTDDLPGALAGVDVCVDSFAPLYEQPCGDGAGPTGEDVACPCGGTVITDTTLNAGFDPVVGTTCSGAGLTIADGIALDLGGLAITGSEAGDGISAGDGASVSNGTVEAFEHGAAVTSGVVAFHGVAFVSNLSSGVVVGVADGSTSPAVTFDGAGAGALDNGAGGIVVHPGASLLLADASVLRNAGSGLDVRGELSATNLDVGFNSGYGVLVETDAPVQMTDCKFHDSGHHPTLPTTGSDGIRILRASDAAGFLMHGLGSRVNDNTGNGITLGHATDQSGAVYGYLRDAQIYNNQFGIRVQQKDDVAARTGSTILDNNVYNNALSGLYMSTSTQVSVLTDDRRTISSNQFHHNAVTGQCTHDTGDQVASQVVFDGPVSGTDPSVSDVAPNAGPDPVLYPLDYRCYWGADDSDRVDTHAACNNVNRPGPTFADESGGISNHCMWNGTQCRLAWDIGGTESSGICDSTLNRIYAYVNDGIMDPATQRGVYASNGAYVRARFDTWGVLGPFAGVYADQNSDAQVDSDNDCGSVSTCP